VLCPNCWTDLVRVLIVKTSSLGDLIHTFPALTDAAERIPSVRFDWMVEESFGEVPAWHPAVDRVIPIALRRWRRRLLSTWRKGELGRFRQTVQETDYDAVIDAQGLIKSALPARWARGPLVGYDRQSVREPLASLFYRRTVRVERGLHAIERTRQLFAAALDYPTPHGVPEYGLQTPAVPAADRKKLVLLHGTTWPSKHWPEAYWVQLIALADQKGFEVNLPWGDPDDRLRAERLIKAAGAGELMPRLSLSQLADVLASAAGVVGVDSGLAHLAAAVGTPAVTLYGPTKTEWTGALGPRQRNLAATFECAPCMRRECDYGGESDVRPACFASLPPAAVWAALLGQMRQPR
jgi:heptosyltransferase-1